MSWKLFKFLVSVYPRANKRNARVSRSFLIKKALFEIRKSNYLPFEDIIVEYNKNRAKSFETMVEKPLYYFNPNKMPFPFKYRFLLLTSALFNEKYRQIFYALMMYSSVKRVLSVKSNLYFWNPGVIWRYCFSFLENRKIAYIHTCYYPLFKADLYYANSFIFQVYGLDEHEHVIVTPEHKFVDEDAPINIYFTQLTNVPPPEKRLRSFARYLQEKGNQKFRVYIHYLDRDKDLSRTELADLVNVISRNKSMQNLSKNQLSFSADSSIGFELLSLGIDHYIFYKEKESRPELNEYAKKSQQFISLEEDFASICERFLI